MSYEIRYDNRVYYIFSTGSLSGRRYCMIHKFYSRGNLYVLPQSCNHGIYHVLFQLTLEWPCHTKLAKPQCLYQVFAFFDHEPDTTAWGRYTPN